MLMLGTCRNYMSPTSDFRAACDKAGDDARSYCVSQLSFVVGMKVQRCKAKHCWLTQAGSLSGSNCCVDLQQCACGPVEACYKH